MTDKDFKQFLGEIKKQVKPGLFKNLFRDLKLLEITGEKIKIGTRDKIVKNLLQKQYMQLLQKTAEKVFKRKFEIELLSPEEIKSYEQPDLFQLVESKKREEEREKARLLESNLNPKYTFENFVVGASNQFAHAAAMAVAENPGKAYNPLFIYGGVGLGKTHLMQAIGNYILRRDPNKKVVYVTTETFMNQLIEALKSDNIHKFRERYRSVDILLIDDIQFIGGKERTQIEFFHTFNALYDAEKQVVITSDRPPRDIPTLTERLKSRFEWGLIADIQPPDFETRVAILKRKAEEECIEVSDRVIKMLAAAIRSNVRQLEGALVKLKAKATLEGKPINEDLVRELISGKSYENRKEKVKEVSIKIIKELVSKEFNVNVELLDSPTRKKQVAFARQVAMYMAKKIGNYPYTQIAVAFKRDDHTTVIHAVRKVEELLDKDQDLKAKLEKLELKIKEAVEHSPQVIHNNVDNSVDNSVDT